MQHERAVQYGKNSTSFKLNDADKEFFPQNWQVWGWFFEVHNLILGQNYLIKRNISEKKNYFYFKMCFWNNKNMWPFSIAEII